MNTTKYRARGRLAPEIEKVEIDRESEGWWNYYDGFEEAKAFLMGCAESKITIAKLNLQSAHDYWIAVRELTK